MDQEALQKKAKENREQKALKRMESLRKVTMESNVYGLAGTMLASNKKALNVIEDGIKAVKFHIEQIKDLRKREVDNFTRVMYVLDGMEDYSSDQWDEDQKKHQVNLDALEGLEKAMKAEDSKTDSNESSEDDTIRDSGNSSGDSAPSGGNLDNSGEESPEDQGA